MCSKVRLREMKCEDLLKKIVYLRGVMEETSKAVLHWPSSGGKWGAM
jgi:hypothetical protein